VTNQPEETEMTTEHVDINDTFLTGDGVRVTPVQELDGSLTLNPVDVACERCQTTTATDDPCCSSHSKALCHLCYRRTHFVEVCVAGCLGCASQGLPVVLTRAAVA
jgi:hypothetical protein